MLNELSSERILQCLLEEKYIVKLLRDLEKGAASEITGGTQFCWQSPKWSETHPIKGIIDTNMN